jgi:AraC family transcriptional regulator of adaptative response/methylated-DNA-[protein]-cysteine methyltransferase
MPDKIILYRDIKSPLGNMIAGASPDGICFLEWHDRGGVPRILDRVAKRYRLPLQPGRHRLLDQLEKELRGYFEGTLKGFTVPLDIRGTAFEKQTWHQLLKIPYGNRRSYGDMARSLGKPGAARAVGRANGANYISIVIPCHRVVESSGALRGYGGGLWRKKWLLEHETGPGLDLE